MNEQTRGLSRRSFLTGAAGMGALAALGLTGCAAPKNAAERAADVAAIKSGNASAGASGVDWLGTAPEIASGDIKETVETDVLVVGAGMSGIMAGATLAELGANFVIVEKGAESAATHYDIGAIHSRWQKEQNIDFEAAGSTSTRVTRPSKTISPSCARGSRTPAPPSSGSPTRTRSISARSPRSSSTPRTITPAAPPTSSRPSAIMCPTPAS